MLLYLPLHESAAFHLRLLASGFRSEEDHVCVFFPLYGFISVS